MMAAAHPSAAARRSALGDSPVAFAALLARDFTVLRKNPGDFIARTVIQPLLFVFVLGYVTPRLGQGLSLSAGAAQVATTLLAGMLAVVILFQGIFAVGMPLIQEFGYTREIEDRVLSPLPGSLVAVAKVIAGALQGLLAAVVVFPLAVFIPSTRPDLHVHWAVLLTLAPLAALMCSSLGLFIGTVFDPRTITAMAAIILTPLMFLGCTLYPWRTLSVIPWVQALSLANPLTYVSEGFRAAVTPEPHLSLLVIYPVLTGSAGLLLWQGIRHFQRRIVT